MSVTLSSLPGKFQCSLLNSFLVLMELLPYIYIYIFNMAVKYENLKGVKPLNESKSRIAKDIITEIKMLAEDDDLNGQKELIIEHFSRIEQIN